MATRIPFSLDAEFVGARPAGTFKRDGEIIPMPAQVRFLVDSEDGDVQMLSVSASALDKVQPPFDYAGLARGDRVELRGAAVIQDRGSDRDSFFAVESARVSGAKAKPLAQAS